MNKLTLLKCNCSVNISLLLIRCVRQVKESLTTASRSVFHSSLYPGWLRCIIRAHLIVNPIANLGNLGKLRIRRKVQTRARKIKTTRRVCVKWQMVRDGFRSCLSRKFLNSFSRILNSPNKRVSFSEAVGK